MKNIFKIIFGILVFNSWAFAVDHPFYFDCRAVGSDSRVTGTMTIPTGDTATVYVDLTTYPCDWAYTSGDITPLHSGVSASSSYAVGSTSNASVNVYRAGVGGYNMTITHSSSVINGVCGTDDGTTISSIPYSNLCTTGNLSPVTTNTTTYDWTCSGVNGGTTASCQANITGADTTPPTISSISLSGTPDVNSTSVTFIATFSENVINIDISDFELTTTGSAVGTIASVSASSGSSVNIVVNNIDGLGTIRLDLKTTHNLTDSATNALSGGYTSGSVHNVDFKPVTPSNFTVTALNDTQISLNWIDNSNNENNFTLYSSSDGVNFELNETLALDTTTKLLTGLTPTTTYYFQVGVINSYGENNTTIENNTTLDTVTLAPLSSGGNTNSTQVDLSWTNSSTIETGYKIYINGAYNSTVGANVTSKIMTGLTADISYNFRIDAYITVDLLLTSFDLLINSQSATIKTNDPASFTFFTNQSKSEDFGEFNLSITDLVDNDSDNISLTVESNDSSLLNIATSWSGNLAPTDYSNKELNITFDSIANAYGVAEINVSSYDGKDYVTNLFQVEIVAVNDTPVVTTNSVLTILEGGSLNILDTNLSTTDVDTNTTLTYTLTSIPTNGTLYKVSTNTALNLSDTFTQLDINSSDINYTHNGGESTSDSFTFSVSDESNSTATGTFNIAVTPVNDIPTINTISNIIKSEDFSEFNITINTLTDEENESLEIKIDINDSSILTLTPNWENNLTNANYVNSDFNLSVTPIANAYGIVEVNVSAYDGTDYKSTVFQIDVVAVDDNATITTISNIDKDINFNEFNISFSVNDVDKNELNVSIDINDTNLIDINATWENNLTYLNYNSKELNISVKSKPNVEGVVRFIVSVEDNQSSEINSTFDLNISAYNFVLADLNALTLPTQTANNLILPQSGSLYSSSIIWSSDKPSSINEYGGIYRGSSDEVVILTASAKLVNTTLKREFSIIVEAQPYYPPPTTTTTVDTSIGSVEVSEDVGEIEVTTSEDGTQTLDITYEGDATATIEVSEDGSASSTVSTVDESGNVVETSVELPVGTEVSLTEDGSIEQTLKTESGVETKVTTSPTGTVALTFKTADGKEVTFNAPAGTKVEISEDGSSKQSLSTKDTKTEIKSSAEGETEVNLASEDGKSLDIKLEVEASTEVKADGSIVQIIENEVGKATLQASKRAEVKAVVEIAGLKLELTPPAGSKVSVSKDGVMSIANQAMTSEGFVNSEIKINSDGSSSVEINIESSQRGVEPKKLTYSTRKDISGAKLEVILDERESISRKLRATNSKAGRVKAIFSTRKEFSYKNSNLRNLNGFDVNIAPEEGAKFQENLYFNNSSDLSLTAGKANITASFDNSNLRKAISDKLQSTRKSFSMKADKSLIEDSGAVSASMIEEGSTITISANSEDMEASIVIYNKNKRDVRGKVSGKKVTFSTRKEFSNIKLEVIENDNLRNQKAKLKAIYSTRGSFSFKNDNLRDMSEIEIIPTSEDTLFEESINRDGTRTITILQGSAQIIRNGKMEWMSANINYELPPLETIEVSESLTKKQDITLNLNRGWNLVSSPVAEDISDKFVFGDYDVIWSYKNYKWYKNPNMIYHDEGIWIASNSTGDINFSGESYIPNLKTIPTKWALIGIGEEINDIEAFTKENKIKEVYLYRDNNWSSSKDIKEIKAGEGLWIEKLTPDYYLNLTKGWNLASLPTSEIVIDMSIFGDYKEIIIYKDGEWIKTPESIEPMKGFGINSNENVVIPFYGEIYDLNISKLSNGVNLVGGKLDFSTFNFEEFKSIWIFKNENWQKLESSNDLNLISIGDGFLIEK